MRLKKWYAIQTYAGSELKVKEDLNDRVRKREWERAAEKFNVEGEETFFLVPVEEVITSRSRRGATTEYRIPYEYDLVAKPNERTARGDVLARKAPRHMEESGKITDVEVLQRVVIELTNRNEETHYIPADKRIRRDIRLGEKIRNGVPLTTDSDEKYTVTNRGTIVVRDKVRRVTLEHEGGREKKKIVLDKCAPTRLRKGGTLKEGDVYENEDQILSRASGLLKVKEYKDKRVVTIQRIEKRRLFPGYVFCRLGLEDEQMMELIDGIKGAVRYVGSRFKPMPIEGPEMKLIRRKAGLMPMPTAASPAAAAAAAGGEPRVEVDFTVGEVVEIVEGPFADFTGEVKEIDKDAEEVTVMVKIFGRETPVRLGFEGIDKL